MNIYVSHSYPFNLDVTLCCGQVFRWNKKGQWWYGVVREKIIKIRHIDDKLEFKNIDKNFAKNYFGLNDDLPKIVSQISKDKHIKAAVEASKGLRILQQDPWECLISYICATYKNISAIKQMLFNISKKFGDKIHFDGYDFYTFPTPEKLARTTAEELARCGLGYRAQYVSETAKMIYENNCELESLRNLSYEKAKEELIHFPGVGSKVADCVLLFSLGKLEAFPVDVWVKRVIVKYYADYFPKEFIEKISDKESLTSSEYVKLSIFGRRYFGEYAGYAQEHLYVYERARF